MSARKVPAAFNKEWSGEDGEELKPYQKVFANQMARTIVKERLYKSGGVAAGCVLGIVATFLPLWVAGAATFMHLWLALAVLVLVLVAFGRYAAKFYELREVGNKYDKEWDQTVREIHQPDLGPTMKVAAPMVDLQALAGGSGASGVTGALGTPVVAGGEQKAS
jgi:hypothetical protein